jgi:hypothetical protein
LKKCEKSTKTTKKDLLSPISSSKWTSVWTFWPTTWSRFGPFCRFSTFLVHFDDFRRFLDTLFVTSALFLYFYVFERTSWDSYILNSMLYSTYMSHNSSTYSKITSPTILVFSGFDIIHKNSPCLSSFWRFRDLLWHLNTCFLWFCIYTVQCVILWRLWDQVVVVLETNVVFLCTSKSVF